ncbi:hypothetical protein EW785_17115 [Salmonella enterica]|nr:hypothetical protein [Salmonella enterica]
MAPPSDTRSRGPILANIAINLTFRFFSDKSYPGRCMRSLLSVKSRALVAITIFMRFAIIIILPISFL